tara:strand:+ start:212 stop:1393 length:1182 start_codon:yes stop_codon:yes gene_type:complete
MLNSIPSDPMTSLRLFQILSPGDDLGEQRSSVAGANAYRLMLLPATIREAAEVADVILVEMNDALATYQSALVWDDHCGFTVTIERSLDDLLRPWHDAGVNYLSVNIYYDRQPWTDAMESATGLRGRLAEEAPYCQLVSRVDDITLANQQGQLAVAMDIEGMNALNGRVELVQTYYDLGVRHMMIAYNRNNLAGAGCHDQNLGLTDFGCKVIDEMNRVGMVVDCSHTGIRTSLEAMARSAYPVVVSHTSPRALVDHERNITDEQIKACAQTGGVVGISGVNLFLGADAATPEAVAGHIAYVAELVGVEHVGISLDFDPEEHASYESHVESTVMEDVDNEFWPQGSGYDRPAQTLHIRHLPDIARSLMELGFTADELRAILGGNFFRVAKEVWR